MPTNTKLEERELVLLLLALLKARSIFFDCIKLDFDPHASPKPQTAIFGWQGQRGTIPILKEIEKALAIVRLHVNSEEALRLYEAMGLFEVPKDKEFFDS
jgi:hypothetical protein